MAMSSVSLLSLSLSLSLSFTSKEKEEEEEVLQTVKRNLDRGDGGSGTAER